MAELEEKVSKTCYRAQGNVSKSQKKAVTLQRELNEEVFLGQQLKTIKDNSMDTK